MGPSFNSFKLVFGAVFNFIIYLHLQVSQVEGENILFFYGGGTYSHKHAIWPLVSALGDKGHNITFLSPHSKRPWSHQNVTDVTPARLEKLLSVFHTSDKLGMRLNGEERMVWDTLSEWSLNICKTVLEDTESSALNSILHGNGMRFDIVMINAFFGECGYIIAEKWGTKIILIDSTSIAPYFYDSFGLPSVAETSWIPDLSSQFLYPMSFWDKIRNFLYSIQFYFHRVNSLYPGLDVIMEKYLKNPNNNHNQGQNDHLKSSMSFQELEKERTTIVFLNTHYSTDFARSLPPNFIHVGGLQLWESRTDKIPKKIQEFMDRAEDGVILMVFGTSYDISKTSRNFLKIFFEAMKTHPKINFVINWEGNIPADIPKNILLSKWLPQREILAHPKMKGFISHCGLYSLAEATYHGVPIIGLPLVADEDYDAYRIEMENIGVRLEVKSLTIQDLTGAIREILENPKYKRNMEQLSTVTRDRQVNPIDVGVWWTEFALRHTTNELKSLRPRTEELFWFQLRSLDVHAFCFTVIVGSSIVMIKIVNSLVSKIL